MRGSPIPLKIISPTEMCREHSSMIFLKKPKGIYPVFSSNREWGHMTQSSWQSFVTSINTVKGNFNRPLRLPLKSVAIPFLTKSFKDACPNCKSILRNRNPFGHFSMADHPSCGWSGGERDKPDGSFGNFLKKVSRPIGISSTFEVVWEAAKALA